MNTTRLSLALLGLVLIAGCEKPPPESVQRGYRGTAMVHVANPATLEANAAKHQAPEPLPPASPDGPKAGQVYQNVKVLGHLSVAEFARSMVAITAWVAPEQGCAYCHAGANFADDGLYTKVVARRMLQMTQGVNERWQAHVGQTGVTCFTCHRGQNVPPEVWFAPLPQARANSFAGNRMGQNEPAPTVAYASLPKDPFTPYLLDAQEIRVEGEHALPLSGSAANRQSTKQTEWTFALMMHMSKSLGVNCTQCHNTRAFGSWGSESSPPRLTAWQGIRMARELNVNYMVPLTSTFPRDHLGPMGDVAKVNCATCHQGAHKPLFGAQMAKHYPELLRSSPPALPASAVAPDPAASVAALNPGDLQALSSAMAPAATR